jgi:hypothetical protein
MLTYKQWCASKRRFTQAQRAGIPEREKAAEIVQQMTGESLAISFGEGIESDGLLKEDVDYIFHNQPVHFDSLGYVPHWFSRDQIAEWGAQYFRRLQKQETKAE